MAGHTFQGHITLHSSKLPSFESTKFLGICLEQRALEKIPRIDVRWICSALKQRCFRFSNLNLLVEALILEIWPHLHLHHEQFKLFRPQVGLLGRKSKGGCSKTMCHHAVHRPSFTKKRSFPSWNLLLDFFCQDVYGVYLLIIKDGNGQFHRIPQ